MEKKRILIYTNHFYPENFKVNDIAFDFANDGYSITVITGIPNYPHGRIYNGYGILKKRKEIINNVEVIRLPLIARGSGSNIRLIFNYFSYFISTLLYTLWLATKKKYDIVFVHETSPIFICISAILYKKLRKSPLITWILDLWPESVLSASTIKNKYVISNLNKLVVKIYQNSDIILTSSKSFEKSILERGNFADKIQYFPNWAEDIFLDVPSQNFEKDIENIYIPGGFKVMYTGNIGESQNFEIIIDAALKLKSYEGIKFIFVGSGRKVSYIEEKIKLYELTNIHLVGNFPIKYMPYFFGKSDVMLVSLKDELIFNLTVPAKLQAYMGFGRPIIALLKGEGANIVEESKCGYICSQSDSDELVKAILELSNSDKEHLIRLGKNAKDYYLNNFSKQTNFNLLKKIISDFE